MQEIPDRDPIKTHREHSRDINQSAKSRRGQSKKRSKSKQLKDTLQTSQRKSSQVKKNVSDVIKAPKKKLTVVNNSYFLDEESFRGSLPGLSGKKVLQRFAPLLSENQKI